MRGAVLSLHQYAFMAWCLVKHRDSFTFTLSLYLFTYFTSSYQLLMLCSVDCYVGECLRVMNMQKFGRNVVVLCFKVTVLLFVYWN